MPLPESPRQRIRKLAISFADRYQANPPKVTDSSQVSTFYVLVDFMTFFDEIFNKRQEIALSVNYQVTMKYQCPHTFCYAITIFVYPTFQIIQKLKVIPLCDVDVDKCVRDFHGYAEEIRTNIPDLIVATMEALYVKYKKLKESKKTNYFAPSDDGTQNVIFLAITKTHCIPSIYYH